MLSDADAKCAGLKRLVKRGILMDLAVAMAAIAVAVVWLKIFH